VLNSYSTRNKEAWPVSLTSRPGAADERIGAGRPVSAQPGAGGGGVYDDALRSYGVRVAVLASCVVPGTAILHPRWNLGIAFTESESRTNRRLASTHFFNGCG
jgi:hypothetical protein